MVCSASTRVCCPSTSIVGRNVAARALWEVGATSTVLRSSSSSDCTMIANLAPRCSWPRAREGAGRRNTSPRTTQPPSGGASSSICSRTSRISSRSSESAAKRRASSRIAERVRAARRSLLQGGSHRFRIVEPLGAHAPRERRRSRRRDARGGNEPRQDCSTIRATPELVDRPVDTRSGTRRGSPDLQRGGRFRSATREGEDRDRSSRQAVRREGTEVIGRTVVVAVLAALVIAGAGRV